MPTSPHTAASFSGFFSSPVVLSSQMLKNPSLVAQGLQCCILFDSCTQPMARQCVLTFVAIKKWMNECVYHSVPLHFIEVLSFKRIYNNHFVASLLLTVQMKEVWKLVCDCSVSSWQSYLIWQLTFYGQAGRCYFCAHVVFMPCLVNQQSAASVSYLVTNSLSN